MKVFVVIHDPGDEADADDVEVWGVYATRRAATEVIVRAGGRQHNDSLEYFVQYEDDADEDTIIGQWTISEEEVTE